MTAPRPWCWWCRECAEDYAPAWRELHDAANYGEAWCWTFRLVNTGDSVVEVWRREHRMIRVFFDVRDAQGRPRFGPAIRVDDTTIP